MFFAMSPVVLVDVIRARGKALLQSGAMIRVWGDVVWYKSRIYSAMSLEENSDAKSLSVYDLRLFCQQLFLRRLFQHLQSRLWPH